MIRNDLNISLCLYQQSNIQMTKHLNKIDQYVTIKTEWSQTKTEEQTEFHSKSK